MASRSEAHEILSLLIDRGDVLQVCICNNTKERVQGKFYQKLKDAACHLKPFESNTPWSIAAERNIKEFKKRAGKKTIEVKSTKAFVR